MTTPATRKEYCQLAKGFYKRRLPDDSARSSQCVIDALQECAHEYRPAYWRRLRCAIAYDRQHDGFGDEAAKIRRATNPVTTAFDGVPLPLPSDAKRKQRRAKWVKVEDTEILLEDAKTRGDQDMIAAINLADTLGVRPIEMLSITVHADTCSVSVVGAKKTDAGDRGADRELAVHPDYIGLISESAERLHGHDAAHMKKIQDRVWQAARRLWPRRKARPSLYSYRHQLGGRLKAEGLDRGAIAYIMGHQATRSVDVYGDSRRRKSRGGIGIVTTTDYAERFEGRVNHTAPPPSVKKPTQGRSPGM